MQVFPNILEAQELVIIRQLIAQAQFFDGKLTAGTGGNQIKNNLQLSRESQDLQRLNQIIINSLARNLPFQNWAPATWFTVHGKYESRIVSSDPERYTSGMSNIEEIEAAIEKLPAGEVAVLAEWFGEFRARQTPVQPVENWLQKARGAAKPETTTDQIMSESRGEQ